MKAWPKGTRYAAAFRICLLLTAGCLAVTGAGAYAQSGGYAEVWGPPAGSPLPLLAAQDQDGRPRALEDLTGQQGLLLFLYRSADW